MGEGRFVFENKDNRFKCELYIDGISVSKCCINRNSNTWEISAWYTREGYMHQGFGKKTMKYTIDTMVKLFGIPEAVNYIWNGKNSYVYEWITKNFDAVCECPLSVQKYANDDDWSSHIYNLDKDKFFSFFQVA